MAIAKSRITSQGQVSIPADIRKRLGIGPGSVIEWEDVGGMMTIRRVGRYSSEDIHQVIFPGSAPPPRTLDELKQGVAQRMRKRYARD